MKMTLLEMVQNILSAMESDPVNSISDTPEGQMVADVIKETYFDTIAQWEIPELASAFFSLEGLADTARPHYLQLPDDIQELYWFKYDVRETIAGDPTYSDVRYCAPQVFFERVLARDLSDSNVTSYDTSDGVPLFIVTDKKPEFYTIINDRTIICDSFDSDVDTTLQGAKTVAGGRKEPSFTLEDGFTPDMDANLFPFLLQEAKAMCFANIKQTTNPEVSRKARENKVRIQNEKHRFRERNRDNPYTTGPNYGRK